MKIYSSPLCSCTKCKQVKSAKGIYSHYLAAHTEEGNKRVRTALTLGKDASTLSKRGRGVQNKAIYRENPNHCKQCTQSLPFNKRHNIFCSHSCAAISGNESRSLAGWTLSEEQKKSISDTLKERHKNGLRKVRPKKPKKDKPPKLKRGKPLITHVCDICPNVIVVSTKKRSPRKYCSKACQAKVFSERARNNPMMGGNRNNRAYGWYTSPTAGRVYLESSYEYKVAVELDREQIKWSRPSYLLYDSSRKYFPDFYLIDYNIYLDPKNSYLMKQDEEKIDKVMKQNNVLVLVIGVNQLDWISIKQLIETKGVV